MWALVFGFAASEGRAVKSTHPPREHRTRWRIQRGATDSIQSNHTLTVTERLGNLEIAGSIVGQPE
ncbi:hypothetical protein NJ7G_2924 [Natrinema sp. J7-2]|nr:hypothetical protein NJ7G_2924 [Natrinema sp. J7-2]